MKAKNKIVCSVMAIIALITGGVVQSDLMVSQQALEIIGNAEGCRLDPYVCPSGLITNGVGNTHGVDDKPVTEIQVVASMGDAPMSQGQIDAFTSFIFNTGCTRFRHNPDGSETRIYKHIRQGNYSKACNELKFWVYGAGKKLPGLVKRRQKETELCFAN